MDKRWMRRLILLDAVLVLVLGWLALTVWEEAQASRKQARKERPEPPSPPAAIEKGFQWDEPR